MKVIPMNPKNTDLRILACFLPLFFLCNLSEPVWADTSVLTDLRLKATPGKVPGDDLFVLNGRFTAIASQIASGPVTFHIGSFSQTLTLTSQGSGSVFTFKSSASGITQAKLDTAKQKFMVQAKHISLAGLQSPVTVEISTNDYQGSGQVDNSKGDSILFLRGMENYLSIDRVTFKLSGKSGGDSLKITGKITTTDYEALNLANQEMTLVWGSYSVSISQGGFVPISSKSDTKQWKYQSPKNSPGEIVSTYFDMPHALYTLVIKNANIGTQTSPVSFQLLFGNFNEMIEYTIPNNPTSPQSQLTVFGYNDLGMHCMNEDFSEMMILPPFNNLHAQIIDPRGEDPQIVTSGVTVTFSIPTHTTSADKTNFWTYAPALFNTALADNIGLTGTGLSGSLQPTGTNDWAAVGIPVTPLNDAMVLDPYPSALIRVLNNGTEVAHTQAIVPVSWEISCDLCHNTPGISTATDILQRHDTMHGTNLAIHKPVRCNSCHEQEPLKALNLPTDPAYPGLANLSHVMHSTHTSRFTTEILAQVNHVACYACHPGIQTQCLRGVHKAENMDCEDCHGTLSNVAEATRHPWIDEPRCDDCHSRSGFEFEQPNTLYRNSKGHHGVHCEACHGSPHAITPTITAADNVQAITLQGHAGPINKCSLCHGSTPDESFDHRFSEGGD